MQWRAQREEHRVMMANVLNTNCKLIYKNASMMNSYC